MDHRGWVGVLTPKQAECVEFAARGWTNKRIGRELWVQEETVKFHLYWAYKSLGVHNRVEAARWWWENVETRGVA